ncbi:Hypothetical predicted protein [Paramuricea clavata]|uniref:Uncharacterized protein n=1 Tax=Paramuricea clavata TaxID=317549 RepID=A0A7D9HQH0_PARCT|nr:Hypothetical predicted protein [Paramuricea clavata]
MPMEALIISLTCVQLHPTDPRQQDPGMTSVETTSNSPVPPTPVPSNTAVTDQAASAVTQEQSMMRELANRTIPDENLNKYLHHLKPKTPVNIVYLQHEFKNHPDVLFISNLVQGFRDGFSIGFEGPRMPH